MSYDIQNVGIIIKIPPIMPEYLNDASWRLEINEYVRRMAMCRVISDNEERLYLEPYFNFLNIYFLILYFSGKLSNLKT